MSKYLRMPANAQFDDDDDSSSDEEEEEEEHQTMNNRSDNKKASLSSSEDEDDDDDNEGDDDEDDDSSEEEEEIQASRKRKPKSSSSENRSSSSGGGSNKRKTKKAKKAGSSFFDEEAEADDDDEEEEVYGDYHDPHDVVKKHYTKEDIERENMDKEMERAQRRIDMRRNREGDFFSKFQDHSDVDVAKQIEKRHIQSRKYVSDRTDYIDEREDEELSEMPQSYQAAKQQSVLPSVSDPSLWMFSCPNGKEDELVYQIMNKSIAYAKAGKPLGITSAVAAQSKGRVYVESFSEPALIEAIKGIRNLMQYTMRLVPISDMTTVMTVVPKKKPVKKNEWVRLTRGHYKGDLALVKDVTSGGQKAIIQCVPRIDIQAFDLSAEEQRIRRRTVRPPQKFFNLAEMKARELSLDRKRFAAYGRGNQTFDFFEGNYYHDGYLLKEVNVGTMIKPYTDDDPPTLDELQRFRQSGRKNQNNDHDEDDEENEGSKQAGSLLEELSEITGANGLLKEGGSTQGGGLLIGDTIEVVEGDLVGLRGKIISMDGTTVKVQPDTSTGVDLGGLNEVEFLSSQIRKHIPVGAHVKVTSGRYANETGTVVAVEQLEGDSDFTAVVLTDMTHKEISVRVSQVKESAEVASGQDKLAGYELHDLVVLTGGGSANEVGVIVRVGREDFTVMNHQGIVREARPEDLRGKRNSHSSRAVALDAQGSQIRVGDSISVMEGPHKGKTATIKRMNRAQLFLYSQTRHEHAGIFVVRGRSCVLAGSSKKSNRNAAGDALNSPYASPRSQNSGGPGGRGRKDDTLIQKTVRIQSGKWKGYLGCVSDANPTHVQVELHSRMKKIMVARDRVAVIGDRFGATDNPERTNNPYTIGAPTTPFLGVGGGATPMHGGATPMHGTATPMHDGFSSVSDVWRPDGGGGGGGSSSSIGDDESNNAIADESSSTWTGGDQGSSTNAFEADSTKGGGWGSSTADQSDADSTMWTPSTSGGVDDDSSLASNMTPQTYGTSDDHATNSAMVDSAGEVPAWFMDHVCVTLTNKDNGAKGFISEVSGDGVATVILDESGEQEKVRYTELALVKPVEHDMVVVTGGSDVGVEGELVCIDNTDAILKDSSEEYKIVDFVFLAKIKKEDE